jgi:hypothetical protein
MLFGTDPVDLRSGQINDSALEASSLPAADRRRGGAIEAARHGCVQAVMLINHFAAPDPLGAPTGSDLDTDLARLA